MLAENNDILTLEDGTYIVNEARVVSDVLVSADNENIGQKIIDDDILDFSEKNPFSLTRNF
jgi:hypothetical protein